MVFRKGSKTILHGLARRSDLNGMDGTVIQKSNDRFAVLMTISGSGTTILVKPVSAHKKFLFMGLRSYFSHFV